MSAIGDLIRQMGAAGAPPDLIAMAVEAMEGVTPKPSSSGAERTRRWREKKASHTVTERHIPSPNVTGDNGDVTPVPFPETKRGSPDPLEKTQPLTLTPSPPSGALSVSPPSRFEEFWQVYPRKVAKSDARRAFDKATHRAGFDAVMIGLRRCTAIWAEGDQQFIPHPATWLNRDGWLDELFPARRAKSWHEHEAENNSDAMKGAVLALQIMKEKDRKNGSPVGIGPAKNGVAHEAEPPLPEIEADARRASGVVIGLAHRLASP